MERRPNSHESDHIADTAQIFDFPPTVSGAEPAYTPLMDISVNEETEQLIRYAGYHANIQIQLPTDGPTRHPEFEMFLREHAHGRGLFPTIDRSQVLDLLFDVIDDGVESRNLVALFADDLLRFLDLPSNALMFTEVCRFDDEDAAHILHGPDDIRD